VEDRLDLERKAQADLVAAELPLAALVALVAAERPILAVVAVEQHLSLAQAEMEDLAL